MMRGCAGSAARERRERGIEPNRDARRYRGRTSRPCVERRPLDARVADVDEQRHAPLRTLTSPATTRRRSPPAVSTSSAPSASMPTAVPTTGSRRARRGCTARPRRKSAERHSVRYAAKPRVGIVGEQRGELVDERAREHGARRRLAARAPS